MSEALSEQSEGPSILLKSLEENCWLYDRQLLSWTTSCGAEIVALAEHLISVQDLKDKSDESALPSTELAMAHLGLIYWTTCNLLSQILLGLTEACRSTKAKARLPPHPNAYFYCRKVDRLLPYFQKRSVGSYFVSFVGWPVAVAVSFLARQGELTEAREFLARALDCEQGTLLKRFFGTWPWMTDAELQVLGSADAQAVAK